MQLWRLRSSRICTQQVESQESQWFNSKGLRTRRVDGINSSLKAGQLKTQEEPMWNFSLCPKSGKEKFTFLFHSGCELIDWGPLTLFSVLTQMVISSRNADRNTPNVWPCNCPCSLSQLSHRASLLSVETFGYVERFWLSQLGGGQEGCY